MCLLSEAPSPQKTDLQVRDFEKKHPKFAKF